MATLHSDFARTRLQGDFVRTRTNRLVQLDISKPSQGGQSLLRITRSFVLLLVMLIVCVSLCSDEAL